MLQDKIYIRTYHKDGKLIREDAQSCEWHRSATQSERFTNTEYIRKDALLEWLKEQGYEDTDRISVSTLIDKLNNF